MLHLMSPSYVVMLLLDYWESAEERWEGSPLVIMKEGLAYLTDRDDEKSNGACGES